MASAQTSLARRAHDERHWIPSGRELIGLTCFSAGGPAAFRVAGGASGSRALGAKVRAMALAVVGSGLLCAGLQINLHTCAGPRRGSRFKRVRPTRVTCDRRLADGFGKRASRCTCCGGSARRRSGRAAGACLGQVIKGGRADALAHAPAPARSGTNLGPIGARGGAIIISAGRRSRAARPARGQFRKLTPAAQQPGAGDCGSPQARRGRLDNDFR